MKNYMHKIFIATIFTTSSLFNVASFANEQKFCDEQNPLGKLGMTSRVDVRSDAPPSAEYRRPADEVLIVTPQLKDGTLEKSSVMPFASGWHIISDEEKNNISEIAKKLSQKTLERIEVVGFADVQNLTTEAQKRYPNNQILSEARATEVAKLLSEQLKLKNIPISASGAGEEKPVKKCDANSAKSSPVAMQKYQSCLSENRRVEIRAWYAEKLAKNAACNAKQASGANSLPFRISIDGSPLDGSDVANSADTTRCTDIALEKADIQVRFDGLETTPVLNITAAPGGAVRGEDITFTPYSNYPSFIKKAELRFFEEGSGVQTKPLAVIEMDKNADKAIVLKTPADYKLSSLQYVFRVYDADGKFDETTPKILHILDKHRLLGDEQSKKREDLIGYGENHLGIHNILVSGGAVTISGENLKPDTKVLAMGREVPVDANGKFAYRQIMSGGDHKVSIITKAKDGTTAEFNRALYVPVDDWFYVALGDLTVGKNNVSGPVQLVTGERDNKSKGDIYADGRAAFYLKGKVKGEWLLTASADTREQPIQDLFSNFAEKDPRYLLKRIDPNAYYPVYGDDSTSIEDAPTQGKFYVRLEKGDAKILWGNFQTKINGTDLVNYSRSLYGADVEYKSPETTKFGERKTEINGFAADPGTVASLEEFRGTGGSLYYLRSQDLVVGSERVRVETRDRDSGIVLQTKYLTYGQDYEINYLQGRVILREALSSTGADATVVRTGSLSGNPQFLVIGYEFNPSLSAVNNLVKGGHASQWLNDYLKVGVTGYQQDNTGAKQDLKGADATVRYAAGTYLKVEAAKSKGAGDGALSSQNGGFNFNQIPQTVGNNIDANASRAEAAVDLSEISDGAAGKLNGYVMKREEGFSAPGQLTNEAVTQSGVSANIPLTKRLSVDVKGDLKQARTTGDVRSGEVAGNYLVTPDDTVTLAVHNDDRHTNLLAAGNSEILAETGQRTDAAIKVTHAPVDEKGVKGRYEVYGIGQGTLSRDDGRRENNRYGLGGKYDVNDRISILGEATEGNGGFGGKAGAEYRQSDRTTYYTNYVMDTERTDIGYRGKSSNFTTGAKSRYTDSLSVFTEQRYQNFDNGPAGLVHSYGLDLAASDAWTLGGRFENGTLSDPFAGDTDRIAASLSAGYHEQKTKYAGTVEWRDDNNKTYGDRTSWLMKNNLSYQTTPDWRMQAGVDFAISDSGLNGSLDANYTEVNLGYAYRPVLNDRLNMLVKYTYLDDNASPAQLTASRTQFASDYQQRSHVFTIDAIYDLTPRLAVGGKIGCRFGELKDTTLDGSNWFHSTAWLAIARADYHIVKEWDLSGEVRYLNAQEAKDAKAGALIGVYRHVNDNVKIGVGYNFTDFSDDLTNLDYRSQGVFINLISKF